MRFLVVTTLSLSWFATACGPGASPPTVDMKGSCDATQYPCGPFGATVDSVIADVEVQGWRGNGTNYTVDSAKKYSFHDYYRDKSIKALVIVVSTESCVPCRNEQPDTISLFNDYKTAGAGVAFMEAIIQDTAGNPADLATVSRWATTSWGPQMLKIPFDMVNDPTLVLQAYYNPQIFPTQLVIKTSDMTIRWQNTGAITKDQLKTQIDAALK